MSCDQGMVNWSCKGHDPTVLYQLPYIGQIGDDFLLIDDFI
jgi:hypothetical protein